MKLHKFFISILLMAFLGAFAGCDDIAPGDPSSEVGGLNPEGEIPAQDGMLVQSQLPTYVFPHQYTEVAERLVARMKNIKSALSAEVETIILHNNNIEALTPQDYKWILQCYLHWGNIVVVEPEIPEWNQFIINLVDAINMLNARECPKDLGARIGTLRNSVKEFNTRNNPNPNATIYVNNNGEESLDEHFYDMIILRDNDVYFLDDLHNPDDPKDVVCIVGDVDKEGEVVNTENITFKNQLTLNEYNYGQDADLICARLNDKVNHAADKSILIAEGRRLFAENTRGNAQLSDLMTAQRRRFQYRCTTPQRSGVSAICEVLYDVWAVHDMLKKEDIYMVRQSVTVDNAGLHCGPSDKYYFWSYSKSEAKALFGRDDYMAYGPYMKGFTAKTGIKKGDSSSDISNGYFRDVQPSTMTGSTSFSSGFNWNIGGQLGLGTTGVNGAVSGGVTFTESYTTNIPDLSYVQNRSASMVVWDYTAPSTKINKPFLKKVRHESAKPIQTNVCTVNHTFMWVQPNAQGWYYLHNETNVNVEMRAFYLGWDCEVKSFNNTNNKNECDWEITPPNRKAIKCKMKAMPDGAGMGAEELFDYLKRNYSNIGWQEDLLLCTSNVNESIQPLAEEYLKNLLPLIQKDKDMWLNQKKGGLYRLFITDENNDRIAEVALDFRP